MKLTQASKEDFDVELQAAYKSGRLVAAFKYRKWTTRLFNFLTDTAFKGKKRKGVISQTMSIPSTDAKRQIPLVVYVPENTNKPLPIMLYMHGGGYVSGSPEMTPGLEDLMARRACIIVAPRYRRSLDAPYPAAFNDCYDTLLWIKENAKSIGGNTKVIIAGHSAGGGLAAAVSLKNRDQKDVAVAFQMPLYPMLDYRNNTTSALSCSHTPIWDTKTNEICWAHYLKDLHKRGANIPVYASAALNTDYSDFPPTISFVGELEPFRDEVVEYINQLKQASIPTQFKLFPKAFHGFESVVPQAKISIAAQSFLLDAYAHYYDNYCNE